MKQNPAIIMKVYEISTISRYEAAVCSFLPFGHGYSIGQLVFGIAGVLFSYARVKSICTLVFFG